MVEELAYREGCWGVDWWNSDKWARLSDLSSEDETEFVTILLCTFKIFIQ